MENASYHSRLAEKTPVSSWKKAQIKEWLYEKNISYEDDTLKTELLDVVRQNKPSKVCVTDAV
jgi:hypothetical protein